MLPVVPRIDAEATRSVPERPPIDNGFLSRIVCRPGALDIAARAGCAATTPGPIGRHGPRADSDPARRPSHAGRAAGPAGSTEFAIVQGPIPPGGAMPPRTRLV
jgi:hypothetical protein